MKTASDFSSDVTDESAFGKTWSLLNQGAVSADLASIFKGTVYGWRQQVMFHADRFSRRAVQHVLNGPILARQVLKFGVSCLK
jgi:hypothetical protein